MGWTSPSTYRSTLGGMTDLGAKYAYSTRIITNRQSLQLMTQRTQSLGDAAPGVEHQHRSTAYYRGDT